MRTPARGAAQPPLVSSSTHSAPPATSTADTPKGQRLGSLDMTKGGNLQPTKPLNNTTTEIMNCAVEKQGSAPGGMYQSTTSVVPVSIDPAQGLQAVDLDRSLGRTVSPLAVEAKGINIKQTGSVNGTLSSISPVRKPSLKESIKSKVTASMGSNSLSGVKPSVGNATGIPNSHSLSSLPSTIPGSNLPNNNNSNSNTVNRSTVASFLQRDPSGLHSKMPSSSAQSTAPGIVEIDSSHSRPSSEYSENKGFDLANNMKRSLVEFNQALPNFVSKHAREWCDKVRYPNDLSEETVNTEDLSQPAVYLGSGESGIELGTENGTLSEGSVDSINDNDHITTATNNFEAKAHAIKDYHKKTDPNDNFVLPCKLGPCIHNTILNGTQLGPKPGIEESFAAVVMADVSGYSTLTSDLAERGPTGAELLGKVMKRYLDQIIQVILLHGGDIVKFVGDAVIFYWKIPKELEHLPENIARGEVVLKAAICCLDLVKRLGSFQIDIPGYKTKELCIHLGIGAGKVADVHVGGYAGRWEHFIAGDAMDQLVHVLNIATAGELALSHMARSYLANIVDFRTLNIGMYNKKCIILTGLESAKRKVPAPVDTYSHSMELWDIATPDPNLCLYKAFINPSALFKLKIDIDQSFLFGSGNGVDDILSSYELRQVTTVFINIGSLRHLEPKRLLDQAQKAMTTVQRIMYECEGVLRQFHVDDKGAVILCFFGVPPFSHGNDASFGVRAASYIHEEFSSMFKDFSIGVTTGVVSIGGVGNSVRTEYAVMGDSINMAARIMCTDEAHRNVVCDERTYSLCASEFDFETMNMIKVKGKVYPINIFKLVSEKVWKDFTPIPNREVVKQKLVVGREMEKRAIADLLYDNTKGIKSSIIFEGDPGQGVSTLAEYAIQEGTKSTNIPIILTCSELDSAKPLHFEMVLLIQLFIIVNNIEKSPADIHKALQSYYGVVNSNENRRGSHDRTNFMNANSHKSSSRYGSPSVPEYDDFRRNSSGTFNNDIPYVTSSEHRRSSVNDVHRNAIINRKKSLPPLDTNMTGNSDVSNGRFPSASTPQKSRLSSQDSPTSTANRTNNSPETPTTASTINSLSNVAVPSNIEEYAKQHGSSSKIRSGSNLSSSSNMAARFSNANMQSNSADTSGDEFLGTLADDLRTDTYETNLFIEECKKALLRLELSSEFNYLMSMPTVVFNGDYNDAELYKARGISDFVLALVRWISKQANIVFVSEEVHWLCSSSLFLLLSLIERSNIIVTSMPSSIITNEESRLTYEQFRLSKYAKFFIISGLNYHETALMIKSVWNTTQPTITDVGSKISKLIYKRSGGNPLYISTLVLALKESGLWRLDGRGILNEQGENFQLETVVLGYDIQSAFLSQFDRLDSTFQIFLKVASVFGDRFAIDDVLHFINAVSGWDIPKERRSALKYVVNKINSCDKYGFLIFHNSRNGVSVSFKSTVIRNYIYTMMVVSRRQKLHLLIALYYEKLYKETKRKSLLIPIFLHYRESGDGQKLQKLRYLEAVSRLYYERTYMDEAIRHYLSLISKAMEVQMEMGYVLYDDLTVAFWHRELGQALVCIGDIERAEGYLLKSVELVKGEIPSSYLYMNCKFLKDFVKIRSYINHIENDPDRMKIKKDSLSTKYEKILTNTKFPPSVRYKASSFLWTSPDSSDEYFRGKCQMISYNGWKSKESKGLKAENPFLKIGIEFSEYEADDDIYDDSKITSYSEAVDYNMMICTTYLSHIYAEQHDIVKERYEGMQAFKLAWKFPRGYYFSCILAVVAMSLWTSVGKRCEPYVRKLLKYADDYDNCKNIAVSSKRIYIQAKCYFLMNDFRNSSIKFDTLLQIIHATTSTRILLDSLTMRICIALTELDYDTSIILANTLKSISERHNGPVFRCWAHVFMTASFFDVTSFSDENALQMESYCMKTKFCVDKMGNVPDYMKLFMFCTFWRAGIRLFVTQETKRDAFNKKKARDSTYIPDSEDESSSIKLTHRYVRTVPSYARSYENISMMVAGSYSRDQLGQQMYVDDNGEQLNYIYTLKEGLDIIQPFFKEYSADHWQWGCTLCYFSVTLIEVASFFLRNTYESNQQRSRASSVLNSIESSKLLKRMKNRPSVTSIETVESTSPTGATTPTESAFLSQNHKFAYENMYPKNPVIYSVETQNDVIDEVSSQEENGEGYPDIALAAEDDTVSFFDKEPSNHTSNANSSSSNSGRKKKRNTLDLTNEIHKVNQMEMLTEMEQLPVESNSGSNTPHPSNINSQEEEEVFHKTSYYGNGVNPDDPLYSPVELSSMTRSTLPGSNNEQSTVLTKSDVVFSIGNSTPEVNESSNQSSPENISENEGYIKNVDLGKCGEERTRLESKDIFLGRNVSISKKPSLVDTLSTSFREIWALKDEDERRIYHQFLNARYFGVKNSNYRRDIPSDELHSYISSAIAGGIKLDAESRKAIMTLAHLGKAKLNDSENVFLFSKNIKYIYTGLSALYGDYNVSKAYKEFSAVQVRPIICRCLNPETIRWLSNVPTN